MVLLGNASLISCVMDDDSIGVLHLYVLTRFLRATLPGQRRHPTGKEPLLFVAQGRPSWLRMMVVCAHNGTCLC